MSFLQLVAKSMIEIPVIQRDYVQGADTPSIARVRDRFVDDLWAALTNLEAKPLHLDFIYGVERQEGQQKIFAPLDGQQRLTTLFLLHWYLCPATQRGWMHRGERSVLRYKVRDTCQAFCQELCQHQPTEFEGGAYSGLREAILDAAWFLREWQYDPSVVNMLGMLECIARRFGVLDDGAKQEAWRRLERPNGEAAVIFSYLEIDDIGIQDAGQLYVKMNARGRQLSAFDRYRVELEGYLAGLPGDEELKAHWGGWFDNEWMHLFWRALVPSGAEPEQVKMLKERVEERYRRFIDLLVFYYFYTRYDGIDRKVLRQGINLEFQLLEHQKGRLFTAEFFHFVRATMQSLRLGDENVAAGRTLGIALVEKSYRYYNRFTLEVLTGRPTDLRWGDRSRFWALLVYFRYRSARDVEGNAKYRQELGEWMRVCGNLIEWSQVEPAERFESLAEGLEVQASAVYGNSGSGSILEYLASGGRVGGCNAYQVLEEQKKAYLLLHDTGKPWRQLIEEAEAYDLLRGRIRILFDKKGPSAPEVYEDVRGNFERLKSLEVTRQHDALLIRSVLSRLPDPDSERDYDRLYNLEGLFSNTPGNWRRLLTDPYWYNAVVPILRGKTEVEENSNHAPWLRKLYATELLEFVVQRPNASKFRVYWNGHHSLYPRFAKSGIALDCDLRDSTLYDWIHSELVQCESDREQMQIPNTKIFWGWDIWFTVATGGGHHRFCWRFLHRDIVQEVEVGVELRQRVLVRSHEMQGRDSRAIYDLLLSRIRG